MSDLAERVRILESWRTGDGARGAEIRLQDVESKIAEIERNCVADLSAQNAERIDAIDRQLVEIAHQQEAFVSTNEVKDLVQGAQAAFIKALRDEKKRGIEKIKAWAPYVAALCALVAAIVPLFFRH
jgi:predicted GTPase